VVKKAHTDGRQPHCFAFAEFENSECTTAALSCLAGYQYDPDEPDLGAMNLRYARPDKYTRQPHSQPAGARRAAAGAELHHDALLAAQPGPAQGPLPASRREPRLRQDLRQDAGPRAAPHRRAEIGGRAPHGVRQDLRDVHHAAHHPGRNRDAFLRR
jgi:hypothetical protein